MTTGHIGVTYQGGRAAPPSPLRFHHLPTYACSCTVELRSTADPVTVVIVRCSMHAAAPALVAALRKAKDSIGALVSAIEQHHATSPCASEALFSEADRQYRGLEMIRAALTLVAKQPS